MTCLNKTQEVETPRIFRQSARGVGKFVSSIHGPSLLPRRYSRYSFLLEAELTPPCHSAATSIQSMKNLSDPIGNQTRDLPPCSALPQPTAPLCAVLGDKLQI